jgi:D-glutamate N-acetyltransferase
MRRVAVLAEGSLDFHRAKTAIGMIRYGEDPVVAVIDNTRAGQDLARALGDPNGLGRGIPVVGSVMEARVYSPDTLLIGIAPRGGQLPRSWRTEILTAIRMGMNVVSGLHVFLGDDPELAAAATQRNVTIWDVRRPSDAVAMRIRQGAAHRLGSHTVYFAGSDCNVGKMTAAFEVYREARKRGLSAGFAATGQTGILISGRGIPADRIISDFLAGATEALTLEFGDEFDWVFVEGQGSLNHPAYSAVTLGLVHGAAPELMILCHQAGRAKINGYDVPIPPLPEVARMYEDAAGWLKPARVVAIALNTLGLADEAAKAAIEEASRETGLPAADPVRFGAGPIVEALLASVPPPADVPASSAAEIPEVEEPEHAEGEGDAIEAK